LYLDGEAVLNKAQEPITRSFESLIELATERLGSMEEAFPDGRMLEYGKTRSAR